MRSGPCRAFGEEFRGQDGGYTEDDRENRRRASDSWRAKTDLRPLSTVVLRKFLPDSPIFFVSLRPRARIVLEAALARGGYGEEGQ